MAIIETIKFRGQRNTSTLAGDIRLEEGRGRLVVYDPATQRERVVHDIAGSHYNNENGDELTLVDTEGLHSYDADNDFKEIVRAGKFPGNNGHGLAVGEEDEDIREAIT